MTRIAITAVLAFGFASAAHAGEGYMCEGEGVTAHFPLGASIGLSLLGAEIEAGGEKFATDAAPGATQIAVSQAMADGNRIAIDFTDLSHETLVAKVRLFWAEEESDPVYGGTLSIVGKGAWAITCSVG
jgi:hypothetical protein